MSFFCSTQEITLHLITISLRLPCAVKVSQTFLVCDDLDNFELYCSSICRMPLGICLFFSSWDLSVFLMTRLGLWVLGRKITEVNCHFYYIIFIILYHIILYIISYYIILQTFNQHDLLLLFPFII